MGKLTALQVKSAKAAGRYNDGEGLMLVVKPSGSRNWTLRMQANGKRRDFGLGSASFTSLSEAREKALETRKQYRAGIDPVEARKASQRARESILSFKQVAEKVFAERKGDWRNVKHRAQWLSTMEAYAFPHIGNMKIEDVQTANIRSLLVPIWQAKPETARRVLQRIGTVLNWAFSNAMRSDGISKGAVLAGLPKQGRRAEHHASLPFEQVPALLSQLACEPTAGRLALRFTILTAVRSGEVRNATWGEVDLEASLWTIPAERMKAKRQHRVPLSAAALAVLNEAAALRTSTEPDRPIFPGLKSMALSDMTLGKVLRSATKGKWTVHGFRTSFRVWAAESTLYPSEVAEAAIAHIVRDKTVAAYRRTDYLARRMDMMRDWAEFLAPPSQ